VILAARAESRFDATPADKALPYERFGCQTPMAPGPPTGMKMGGRRLFDNSVCARLRYSIFKDL
jgi:hypothetical protein